MAERRGRGQGVSVIHKVNLAAKVAEAQEILGLAKRFYDNLEEHINRLEPAWFGSGARLKGQAWKLALEMAM